MNPNVMNDDMQILDSKRMSWTFIVGLFVFTLVSCIAVDNSFEGDKRIFAPAPDPGDSTTARTEAMAVIAKYNCSSCHGATQTPYFSATTSDAAYQEGDSPLVIAGDAENSRLIRSLRTSSCADSGGDCDMPAAPYTATVSDEDYDKLVDWINEL